LIIHIPKNSSLNLKSEFNGWKSQFVQIPIKLVDDELVFNIDADSLLLEVIEEIISYYEGIKIEIEYDSNIKDLLQKITDSEIEFRKFTSYAKQIWHGEYNNYEFDSFLELAKKDLIRVPFSKQFLSAFHLFYSKNACNFSVPGTGKTTILYTAFNALRNSNYLQLLLVVCPLSAFSTWIDEYIECFGKSPQFRIIDGAESISQLESDVAHNISLDIVLINYEKLKVQNQYFNIILYLLQSYEVMFVLDEAHRIKNPSGVQANSVIQLIQFAKSRVVLTGTPVTQSFVDLYNISKFIYPSKNILEYGLYDLNRFSLNQNRYTSEINKLINSFTPYFTRIRKSHFNLPPAIDKDSIELVPTNIEKIIIDSVKNQKGSSQKGAFIRQLQASTNPFLLTQKINWSEILDLDEEVDELKDNEVDEKVKDLISSNVSQIGTKINAACRLSNDLIANGEKVIIWCIFTDTAIRVFNILSKNQKGVLLLGKSNSQANTNNLSLGIENREDAINSFKLDNSIKFAVANPMAVGEAISLHKNNRGESVCKNAIYLERSYNCAQYLQSRDRIHRVGMVTDDPVFYHFFHFSNTIDKKLDKALREKVDIMNSIIEKEEIPLFLNYDEEVLNEIMTEWNK